MENVIITPGPTNNEFLFLATQHRAHTLFYSGRLNEELLDIRRADLKLWKIIKYHPIPVRVMDYIRTAGFEDMFLCGMKLLDHALIAELVERWRPETHTFHLPIGEVTVTLQDVEVMWGLQINGDAVTGKEQKWDYQKMHEMCLELLGFSTLPDHFKKAQLRVKFLRGMLQTALPDDASDEQCIQRARAYILLLFAGVLFPDTSENLVHMNFLSLLEDFDRCSP